MTNQALRHYKLDAVAEVLHTPAAPTERHGRAAWRHEWLPDVHPDFVDVDGPPLDEARPFAVDLLDLEERALPNLFVVVDGRKGNFNFLRMHLRHDYRFRWRRVHYNGTIERLA